MSDEIPPVNSESPAPARKPWWRGWLRELPWLVGFAVLYLFLSSRQAPLIHEGEIVPPFQAETIGAKGLFDSQTAAGKAMVLVFWAPWCTVCAGEIPMLGDLQSRLGGDALVVGVGMSGNRDEREAFVTKHGPKYMNVHGDADFTDAFGIRAFPTIIVVDAQHKVTSRLVGLTTPWRIQLAASLASKP